MAAAMFTRFTHLRNFMNINNVSAIGNTLNVMRLSTTSRSYNTTVDEFSAKFENEFAGKDKSKKKMSKAMKVYLERAKEHEEFMKKEIAEFEIGKRHLANMMGENPENFEQADIDRSIEYLFPSGLYDKQARPMMRHPTEVFPSKKAAEFDRSGRPFHSMFYTSKPNYYEALYEIVDTLNTLNNMEDKKIADGIPESPQDKFDAKSTEWLPKPMVEKLLLEILLDSEYDYFITSLSRLIEHPQSAHANDIIKKYRKTLVVLSQNVELPPMEYDNAGKPFIMVQNCMRKSARGSVIVRGEGSGNITINGQDITYFNQMTHREQMSEPKLRKFLKTLNPKNE